LKKFGLAQAFLIHLESKLHKKSVNTIYSAKRLSLVFWNWSGGNISTYPRTGPFRNIQRIPPWTTICALWSWPMEQTAVYPLASQHGYSYIKYKIEPSGMGSPIKL